MKKYIDRVKYDTSTAKLIGSYDNNKYTNDLYYFEENLYQKSNGNYFLHGSGGAGSKYSKPCESNSTMGSDEIIPLSQEEAQDWAEKHLSATVYENHFLIVDDEEVESRNNSITFRLSDTDKENLITEANECGKSLSEYIYNKLFNLK